MWDVTVFPFGDYQEQFYASQLLITTQEYKQGNISILLIAQPPKWDSITKTITIDITDALQQALAKDAVVNLNGCHTGEADDSLAERLSRRLRGRIVVGSRGFAAPDPTSTTGVFREPVIFQNGLMYDFDKEAFVSPSQNKPTLLTRFRNWWSQSNSRHW